MSASPAPGAMALPFNPETETRFPNRATVCRLEVASMTTIPYRVAVSGNTGTPDGILKEVPKTDTSHYDDTGFHSG